MIKREENQQAENPLEEISKEIELLKSQAESLEQLLVEKVELESAAESSINVKNSKKNDPRNNKKWYFLFKK